MSIIEQQIAKLVEDASIESLRSGQTFSLSEAFEIINKRVRALNGGPTLKVSSQGKRHKFDIVSYNRMISEIKFDLEVLYGSYMEKTSELFKLYNFSDISYKAQRVQIGLVNAALDSLLFTLRNADDYFYGVFDNFIDVSKVDLNLSNEGVVDVYEKAATLPFNAPSTYRLPVGHLIDQKMSNSKVVVDGLVSSSNGGGTGFGYAFTDITSIWRYEVEARSKSGCELSFIVPLRRDDVTSTLTRIELEVNTSNDIVARVLGSSDNFNYTRLPNSPDKRLSSDASKVAWDFPESQVKYIRFEFFKEEPDVELSKSPISNRADTVTNPVISNADTKKTLLSKDTALSKSESKAFGLVSNSDIANRYLYNFNISNISFYRVGRPKTALMSSKPLRPNGIENTPIAAVSLTTTEEVPTDTNIDYFIGLSDSVGNLKTDMVPISPVDTPKLGIDSTIRFAESTQDQFNFTAITGGSDITSTTVSNKIEYYGIYQLPVNREYRFGTAKLYRGGNFFSKKTKTSEIVRAVSDNFIDFSDGSRIKQLYAVKDETVAPLVRNLPSIGPATFLRLGSNIVVSSAGRLIPPTDSNPNVDPNPDYSIFNVQHFRSQMLVENQPIKPSNTNFIPGTNFPTSIGWTNTNPANSSLGIPILLNGQAVDIIPDGPDKPKLTAQPTGRVEYTFSDGSDYTIIRSDDSYFVTNFSSAFPIDLPVHWRIVPALPVIIKVEAGSPLTGQYATASNPEGTGNFTYSSTTLPPTTLPGGFVQGNDDTLYLDYRINPDITHRVLNIDYQSNEVQLDTQLQIAVGDTLRVRYKTPPVDLIRSTVKVTSGFGSDNQGELYQEGVDYAIDAAKSQITRLAGGAINNLSNEIVYVDFSYRDKGPELDTYSVWCFVDDREPIEFSYAPLNLQVEAGESFIWTYAEIGGGATRDLSKQTTFTLSRGWHYFVIKSLNVDKFNYAAIAKVLGIKSLSGYYLFLRKDRGGSIFSKITAFRSPLRQVTLPFYKNATLSTDKSTFAISSSNEVYINYPPGFADDLFLRQVESDGTITSTGLSEEFDFRGIRKLNTGTTDADAEYVVLHAQLSRSSSSNGGITPKVFSYNVRISY